MFFSFVHKQNYLCFSRCCYCCSNFFIFPLFLLHHHQARRCNITANLCTSECHLIGKSFLHYEYLKYCHLLHTLLAWTSNQSNCQLDDPPLCLPRDLLQLHNVHGGVECGDDHHDPQLPPPQGGHPQHARLGPHHLPPVDPLVPQDVQAGREDHPENLDNPE